ncbi:MAG: hypothetical protein SOR95_06575 [Sutterella sp.]|mgnify:CR=1 FL=1|nr:hypothetical protein [Sutterella sp.]
MSDETTPSYAVTEIPKLADPQVLSEILFYTGIDVIRLYLSEDEGAAEQYSAIVFGVSAMFMDAESFVLPAGWTLPKVAAHLREALKDDLAKLPREERELFSDDETMLTFAVVTCFNEATHYMSDWCERTGIHETDAIIQGLLADPVFENMFTLWANLILGDFAQTEKENE